jgi:hypothetical protein
MKNIIFDKSALQALSLNEIEQLSGYLKIVVVPPLRLNQFNYTLLAIYTES